MRVKIIGYGTYHGSTYFQNFERATQTQIICTSSATGHPSKYRRKDGIQLPIASEYSGYKLSEESLKKIEASIK
jgi:hypothetical protein